MKALSLTSLSSECPTTDDHPPRPELAPRSTTHQELRSAARRLPFGATRADEATTGPLPTDD
jgi:hypothetical protein